MRWPQATARADGDGLALPARQQPGGPAQRGDADVEAPQRGLALGAHALVVQQPEAAPDGAAPQVLPVQEQVGRHVERVDHRQRLVHGLDAERAGRVRRGDRPPHAVDADRAGVGLVHAGEALDERGLAGPVVAEQGP